uniref:Surfeit locus protein 6 n=1 Tax=Pogona vitticeps TaxID=103695 RepID=A0A6J0TX51_9SAUR
MASLVNKDSYLQNLAKKICAQEVREPRKRKFGNALGDEGSQLKKKKKSKKAKKRDRMAGALPGKQAAVPVSQGAAAKPSTKSDPAPPIGPGATKSATVEGKASRVQNASAPDGKSSFSGLTLLRQRLHEKIQEISGQGNAKELTPAVLQKRQRRKYEKERKKRRRKELKMKEKMEKKETEETTGPAVLETEAPKEEIKTQLVFNKVDVGEEKMLSKAEKKREKRKAVKGNITPLTGKNYKQLLSRLEARKSKLEELKDKNEEKAKEMEMKLRWTNALYKAEGVKIRDDEDRLKAALKRKEKRKAQRQKQWEKRTVQVVEKMQQRQEKRRKNLQKKKLAKAEKKKAKARKKGRILPEDLEKAGLK